MFQLIKELSAALCLICILSLLSCRSNEEDWNNPVKIYNTLCSCKNQSGQTIDEGLKAMLSTQNIPSGNTDQINTWLNANTDQFVDFIQDKYRSDTLFMAQFQAAQDTLAAHGSVMATKGAFEELFSVKVKYPGCVAAMHLLYQN
ncbi:MAG: hypothetical protein KDC25_00145 [Saprospiraceae bacterium]|jgi:hypothetical protein|nr:hypothetical protein [Saprospiraceae bacterium]